jgi:hypothetical protein
MQNLSETQVSSWDCVVISGNIFIQFIILNWFQHFGEHSRQVLVKLIVNSKYCTKFYEKIQREIYNQILYNLIICNELLIYFRVYLTMSMRALKLFTFRRRLLFVKNVRFNGLRGFCSQEDKNIPQDKGYIKYIFFF